MRAPRPDDFPSRLRSPAVAARVGVWLGVSFLLCFATGLISPCSSRNLQVAIVLGPLWTGVVG